MPITCQFFLCLFGKSSVRCQHGNCLQYTACMQRLFVDGGVKLPPDLANSAVTASAYTPVFETWDSTESGVEGGDAVAIAADRMPDSKQVVESCDSAEDGDAVALTMGKDTPDVIDKNAEVETWDSDVEEEMTNRNSREKRSFKRGRYDLLYVVTFCNINDDHSLKSRAGYD